MYKSITLPDNISFEELAQYWCDYHDDGVSSSALSYDSGEWEFLTFSQAGSYTRCYITFTFDPKSQKLTIKNYGHYDTGKYLLDFIKERSNG